MEKGPLRAPIVAIWIALIFAGTTALLYAITGTVTTGLIVCGWICLIALVGMAYFVLLIAFHEFGHFVAGKLVGYDLVTFRVIRYQIWKAGKRWRFMASPRGSDVGLAEMIPKHIRNLRIRHALFVLGGPFVSLVIFLWGALAFAKVGGFGDWRLLDAHQETVARWIFLVWIFSAGPAGLIFTRTVSKEGHASDGLQLYNLWKNSAGWEHAIIASTVISAWTHLQRPSRWNREAVDYLVNLATDDASLARCHLIAFYYYLDSGDAEVAVSHIFKSADYATSAGDELDARSRRMIYPEAAYVAAHLLKDSERAQKLLENIERPEKIEYTEYFRAEAAILWEEGKHEEARELISWAHNKLLESDRLHGDECLEVEASLLLSILSGETESAANAHRAMPER